MPHLLHVILKERRRQRGLTQKELADRLGVTQGYISQIEKGYIPIKVDFLSKFANTLGMSAVDLQVEAEDFLGQDRCIILQLYLMHVREHHLDLLSATETLKSHRIFQGKSGRTVLLAYRALALAFLHAPEAKDVAQQLLDQCEPESIDFLPTIGHMSLGITLMDAAQYTKANRHFKTAQAACSKIVDPLLQSAMSRNINYYHGLVYSALHQYHKAEHCFAVSDALDRPVLSQTLRRNADVVYELGRVYGLTGKHKDALIHFERTMGLYQQAEYLPGVVAAMFGVSFTCLALGNTKRALSTYQDIQSLVRIHPELMTANVETEIESLATALQFSMTSFDTQS